MLDIWTEKSNYSLGIYQEGTIFKLVSDIDTRISLPVKTYPNPVNYKIISGSLPKGLRVEGNYIVGSAYEVSSTTTSTFVIRASSGNEIADRTFSITIEGPDSPQWITPEGVLPVGITPSRVSKIISASRLDNVITLVTQEPHSFVYGNKITVSSNNPEIKEFEVEILRIPFFEGETSEAYRERTKSLITYRKSGPNFTSTAIQGQIELRVRPLTFILDGSFVDFQLQAIDNDIRADDSIEFFIEDGFGELPPGLSLSRSGRITGFIDPILSLEVTARDGTFDSNLFDAYPYDFGIKQNVGITGFENVYTPKKLNRYYEFYVTISDGELTSQRKFSVYVVGDDFLRVDNTVFQIGNGAFTADSTYLRSPIWTTPSNLGVKRANNYVTLILDAFDPNPEVGPVEYRLEISNPDGSESILPPGLSLDTTNSEIFGFVPYQPAVTEDYTFTVSVIKFDKENITSVEVLIVIARDVVAGSRNVNIRRLPLEDRSLILNDSFRIGNYVYKIISYTETDLGYDTIRLDLALKNDLRENFSFSKTYNQLISQEFTTRKSSKTFTLSILGEVESTIQYLTPEDLGTIKANFPSQLSIRAITTVLGGTLTYTITKGKLPPGLTLLANGDITGKVTQFGNITYKSFWKSSTLYKRNDVVRYDDQIYICIEQHTSELTFDLDLWERYSLSVAVKGLTTFNDRTTTFDNQNQTFDRSYNFTVLARDQFKFSAIERTFSLFVSDPDVKLFSNIYAKPYPSIAKRNQFNAFINNIDIFTPNRIYRIGDPLYGVQKELKMLIFAGIETLNISKYVPAISLNSKKKRLRIGSPKKAIAKIPNTDQTIYEVIYLEIFDDYEKGTKSVPRSIKLNRLSNSPININQTTIDSYNGKIGTINGGVVSYQNSLSEYQMNEDYPNRFRPRNDVIRADSSAVRASGKDLEFVYPTSISNIRKNIKEIKDGERTVDTEKAFLPEWMLTPQDRRTPATGYIKAVPLCYCNPGDADYILENIENSGFDFTDLDFEIDRFIIDATEDNNDDQYLKLPNFRFNI